MVYNGGENNVPFIRITKFGDISISKIMIRVSLLLFQTCTAALISIQPLMPVLDSKKTSNVDEFMVENQRTQMSQNYVLQRALNGDMEKAELRVPYEIDSNINEELPEFILDHANMIRNDVILLDNSVETRTRKRGNIKVKKYGQVDVTYVPCSCEEESKELIVLGDDYFPRTIETRICNNTLCPSPYGCRKIENHITVLKRKRHSNEKSQGELPDDLYKKWIALKEHVTVGCMCTRDYSDLTKM